LKTTGKLDNHDNNDNKDNHDNNDNLLKMKLFNKILIANRGEIAVRIIKAAKLMGIQTVAVYSRPDAEALHTRLADESYFIGEQDLADSYLNVDKIMNIAKQSNCEAIHPGYGFLSENPILVSECNESGIAFIGPSTKAIELMGNKVQSRAFVTELGVPMTKGATGTIEELKAAANYIPLPILVKAAAGGGGKGMRIVNNLDDLDEIIESTSREALSYFGDDEVFIEQFIEDPRHIEIQIIGDKHGNVIHLYERECSIQRRYQKIIEESPSPTLNQETREKMGQAAVDIAKAIEYDSVGTIEFLVDKNMNFYFLEMNTRVQVEHPVTEMVTGVDIVKEQIYIAAGEALSYEQNDIMQKGHAIEARVYAEEPENDFRPAPGVINFYSEPKGEGIRVDAGLNKAQEIKSFFDPMVSKLIVWEEDREKAIQKLQHSLKEYIVLGISTNIPFMLSLIASNDFLTNKISTKYCDLLAKEIVANSQTEKDDINKDILAAAYLARLFYPKDIAENIWNRIGYWRMNMEFKLSFGDDNRAYSIVEKEDAVFSFTDSFNQYVVELLEFHPDFIRIGIDEEAYLVYISENENGGFDMSYEGHVFHLEDYGILRDQDFYEATEDATSGSMIKSPMPGKLIKVLAEKGATVKKGDTLLIVEAMKMENNLLAPRDGIVEDIMAKEGEMVDGSKVLLTLVEEDE